MKTLIVLYIKSQWYSLNIDNFDDYNEALPRQTKNTLISFQTSDLIRCLMLLNENVPLPTIIDLECVDKQMSQQGKEFRNDKRWSAIRALKYHEIVSDDYVVKKDGVKELLENIAELYKDLLEKNQVEKERLEKLEIAINSIIYERQSKGINVDIGKVNSLCTQLEKEIYSIKNRLQTEFNIYDPDNPEQQKAYLDSKKYNLIKSPIFTFKARRNDDEVCRLLYDMLRSEQDLDSLIYMLSHRGAKKCYPIYFGFGTITSRITLREPSLQNLRRTNRSIIIPEVGKKLLYIDYSQFEAGILASLSKDSSMIKLYKEDIYANLAASVLGDKEKRSDAKVLFYRYMYGDTTLNSASKAYFQKFKALTKFKNDVERELLEEKQIGTEFGNFRCRDEIVFNWALSHKIQATASLIYKRAVERVFKEVKGADFMIPMHDGTLYEIGAFIYPIVRENIENIYKEEFKKVCPEIDPLLKSVETFT